MNNQILKSEIIELVVCSKRRKPSDNNTNYFNYDFKTAKQIFKLIDENGEHIAIKDYVHISVTFAAIDPKAKILNSDVLDIKIIETAEVIDDEKGIVEVIIPNHYLNHTGRILGELAIRYNDERRVIAGRFIFNSSQALITEPLPEDVKTFYIKIFDDLYDHISLMSDEIMNAVPNRLTDAEERLDVIEPSLDEKENKLKILSEDLKNEAERLNKITEDVIAQGNKLAETSENVLKIDTQLNKLTDLSTDKEYRLKTIENELSDKEEHLSKINETLKESDDRLGTVETTLSDKESRLTTFKTTLEINEERLEQHEKDILDAGVILQGDFDSTFDNGKISEQYNAEAETSIVQNTAAGNFIDYTLFGRTLVNVWPGPYYEDSRNVIHKDIKLKGNNVKMITTEKTFGQITLSLCTPFISTTSNRTAIILIDVLKLPQNASINPTHMLNRFPTLTSVGHYKLFSNVHFNSGGDSDRFLSFTLRTGHTELNPLPIGSEFEFDVTIAISNKKDILLNHIYPLKFDSVKSNLNTLSISTSNKFDTDVTEKEIICEDYNKIPELRSIINAVGRPVVRDEITETEHIQRVVEVKLEDLEVTSMQKISRSTSIVELELNCNLQKFSRGTGSFNINCNLLLNAGGTVFTRPYIVWESANILRLGVLSRYGATAEEIYNNLISEGCTFLMPLSRNIRKPVTNWNLPSFEPSTKIKINNSKVIPEFTFKIKSEISARIKGFHNRLNNLENEIFETTRILKSEMMTIKESEKVLLNLRADIQEDLTTLNNKLNKLEEERNQYNEI